MSETFFSTSDKQIRYRSKLTWGTKRRNWRDFKKKKKQMEKMFPRNSFRITS